MSDLSRLRSRLLARIHRHYQTTTQRVANPPHPDFEFTRIANPDTVLDQVAAEEARLEKLSGQRVGADQLHLPYWAELWDSAMGLAQHLAKNIGAAEIPRTAGSDAGRVLNVLDLGCGMGLAGCAAAALGHRILFADLEAPALLFAALNSLPWRDRIRTRRLNWQKDALDERFDLILGADILYERAQWGYLDPFWRKHVAGGGRVVLAEPGRQTGDLFLEWLDRGHWNLTQYEQPVPTRERAIRIFELRQASRG